MDGMLRRMTPRQFHEWRAFESLEPFGEERADLRAASIVQAVWNTVRDMKANPKGWPIGDFILPGGDTEWRTPPKAAQTVAQQEFLIDAWVAGNNAAVQASAKSEA